MTKRQDVYWGVNDSTNVVNGSGTSMYDELNRPKMWQDTQTGDNAFAESWQQYDSLSRLTVTWRVEQYNKGDIFAYDASGQLTQASYNCDEPWNGSPMHATRRVTYNVDPLNRISVTDNGAQTGYSPDSLNQYTTVGSQTPSYDANFNLTGFDGATFSYNAQNQLTSGSKGGNTVQFTYDGLGRCLKRTTNGAPVILVYDGWKSLADFAGDGSWWGYRIYGPGPDEVLWLYDSRVANLRVHTDMRGNVTFLLDGSGNGIERYTYDAFGTPTITDWYGNVRSQSAYGNRFLFQGREWLAELGIYDFRSRMYRPALGRFLQKDPLGFGGEDTNLFRYCGGDPINQSDPTGEVPVYNIRGGWYTYWINPGYLTSVATTSTGLTWTGSMWADSTHWCAAGAQALSGAPDTRTWFEGASVTSGTMYGTVIATGWQGGGYPGVGSQAETDDLFGAGSTLNHTGIFLGTDADGNALILNQFTGHPLSINLIPWQDLWEWHEVYVRGGHSAGNGGRGAGPSTPLPQGLANLVNHFGEWSSGFAHYYFLGITQFGAGWGTGSGLNPGSMGGASAAAVQGTIFQTLFGVPGGGGLPGEGTHPVSYELE